MGLDMYLFATPEGLLPDEAAEPELIHSWRKHNALHHWMEDYWRNETGSREVFNCIKVEITEELLDQLEQDIEDNKLTPVSGFFFGDTEYDPADHANEDLKALQKARSLMKKGRKVFYDSWW